MGAAERGHARDNPSIWDAMAADPLLHVDDCSRALQVTDSRRWTRRHLRPVTRLLCMVVVWTALFVKRTIPPLRRGSEQVLNRLGPRFLLRCASPEALELVLRHFAIETQLVNFVARNSGGDVPEVDLLPRRAAELGDWNGMNAVVRHDANIFNLFIDLGRSPAADVHTARQPDRLDLSMLRMPELDLDPGVRRWLKLDLQSTLDVIVATLAVLMDHDTAERAVNSLQLDESLLAAIANLTGDPVFRTWAPIKFTNWVGMTGDVGRDLHWHFVVTEYAHTRLCRMRDALAATEHDPGRVPLRSRADRPAHAGHAWEFAAEAPPHSEAPEQHSTATQTRRDRAAQALKARA
jgi:hypothetical protein